MFKSSSQKKVNQHFFKIGFIHEKQIHKFLHFLHATHTEVGFPCKIKELPK